ncbi:MAG: 50S ribosomal protein L20 [Candidatus Kerfeldbacteria bacterium CG_4_10_14_0_8_um_filter_42_10]|uniref:Large ribosomal subunit protein bL20 n=1 Tax=Candidatus Kerfeldbacteria bacterium CG_4_10_14_0_8_um_filter_42_10 TaxID=2014248 RepID=A0A2M7RHR7_9BACT|nr:MAG: 50S ribosomal protein L20 [Candidatus Kerfeldbacteria bacterium CG_4_10_14_0_8_um_filter_42_10]
MARVKRGKAHLKKRKQLLKRTKGYKWGRKSKIKLAKTAVLKAGVYAYRDRRVKKRDFRRLWQIRINAACRLEGISYSRFINLLKKSKVEIDRKVLADLAMNNPEIFKAIVAEVNPVRKDGAPDPATRSQKS